jgi:ankyrin repeat protein
MGEESLTIAVTTTAGQFSEPIPPTSTRKGSGIAARVRALLHRGASRKQTSLDAVYQYDMKMLKISPKLRNKESKVDRVGRNVIHVAARYGNAETLQLLLAAGFSHNALDCDGFIPLTHALLGGNINAFNLLIKAGSDLTTRDREGRTPLHNAITNYPTSHEKFAVVKILLEAGADVSKTDWKGRTALHFAVETGAKDIVKLLVEWGSEVSVPDDDGRTPLHAAVNFHGNDEVEIVQTLLNAGSDVSAQDGFGDTPLHTSLHQQTIRAQIVKLLLQAGSDLEVDNGRGCTPLRRLYEADIRLTVLPPDADPFSPGGICDGKALRAAAEYGYEDIVTGCLDAGCNPSTPGKNGRTPLHWGSNQPHIVKLLLDRGSNVSAQDMYGKTPLFCAIHSPDSVKLLLGAGADVQVQSKDRTTPLHIAAREPQCDVLDMFIKAGADISARDNLGRTALLILANFATREDKDGIEALYYHSKSSVASSSTGQIKQESKEMGERLRAMLLLVNAGADLLARDKKGRTVLDLCS